MVCRLTFVFDSQKQRLSNNLCFLKQQRKVFIARKRKQIVPIAKPESQMPPNPKVKLRQTRKSNVAKPESASIAAVEREWMWPICHESLITSQSSTSIAREPYLSSKAPNPAFSRIIRAGQGFRVVHDSACLWAHVHKADMPYAHHNPKLVMRQEP